MFSILLGKIPSVLAGDTGRGDSLDDWLDDMIAG